MSDKKTDIWGVNRTPIDPMPRVDITSAPTKREAELLSVIGALTEALDDALAWIDAVPSGTPLPAMPGFDRDALNAVLATAREQK